MKTIIRLPLEQFAFVEQEFGQDMTPEAAVEAYRELQRAWKGGGGLPQKEFSAWLDNYLVTQMGDANQYAKMNLEQQGCIQTLKRSFKRIKSRQDVDVSPEDESMYGNPGKGENGDYSNMD